MYLIKDILNFKSKVFKKQGSIITAGVFDGVHYGHQNIIKEVVKESNSKNLISAVLTFYPHPLQIITKSAPRLISSLDERIKLLKELGVSKVLLVNFNQEIANLSPEDFVSQILIDKLGMKKIWVGEDHTFGIKQRGNIDLLKKMSQKYNFEVNRVPSLRIDDTIISSSLIRKFIEDGDIKKANQFLNHSFCITGRVIKGSNRGKEIGYPTANIYLEKELTIPKEGVYATYIKYKNQYFKSVANIGIRPTFRENVLTLETHIFDFSKNIYQENISVYFIRRIRSEEVFSNKEELVEQIRKDRLSADKILDKHSVSGIT
ncbi:MAG: bifunctional riboflavin kinase/FAD synthetase [bacterium]|nr:bifunctional riboflavin kinase/FAD synthetase [bacterium]